MCFFVCVRGVDFGCFIQNSQHALRVEPPFGADTSLLQIKFARSVIKRITPLHQQESTSLDVLFVCVRGVDFGCFIQNSQHALRVEPPFGADTSLLQIKFARSVIKRITPLHQENPCRLARIFLLKNPLPFDSIFLVLPHSQSFAIISITDKNSHRNFARLSVWCALRCVLYV